MAQPPSPRYAAIVSFARAHQPTGPRRHLAVDPGDKRTGLAVGDRVTGIVTPVAVIVTTDPRERLRRILAAVDDHEAQAVVIGLPLNMDGTAGPAAEQAKALAQTVAAERNLPVHLFDERLTSFAADGQMARSGLTHKQKRELRDALAAATILRDYFAAQANNDGVAPDSA